MNPKPRKHKSRLSRRQFLGAAAAAVSATLSPVTVISVQTPSQQSVTQPETIMLINGKIHTMDARDTIASHVTIHNGRFLTPGNGRPARVPGACVIDLKGRTVIPGIIEGHVHIVSLANRPGYHSILENTTSIREIQEALAARRRDVPEGQWITSMGGWHPNQW